MEILIAAVLGAFSTIVVALLGLYGARKAGIGTTQEKLISNLKGLVESQDHIIKDLQTQADIRDTRLGILEVKVQELTDLTVSQALTIKNLSRRKRLAGD